MRTQTGNRFLNTLLPCLSFILLKFDYENFKQPKDDVFTIIAPHVCSLLAMLSKFCSLRKLE
jgi:hypothetical protein